eukprot:6179542-Pleurochrysis_carterae.AAC.1
MPRELANDLALLNHAARLANDDVFIVTDDLADYLPHRRLAPKKYWFSTLATLLLPGDDGFTHNDKLAFIAEYVLIFGLLCVSNYAQRLSGVTYLSTCAKSAWGGDEWPVPPRPSRQLRRWQTRLADNNCMPLLAAATPLFHHSRAPCSAPTLFVYMDAAKAKPQGDDLGLGKYCHSLFFSLPLSANTRRAKSVATLELMALVVAIATFRDFFCHFPRVVLESVSVSATFHLAEGRQSKGRCSAACA